MAIAPAFQADFHRFESDIPLQMKTVFPLGKLYKSELEPKFAQGVDVHKLNMNSVRQLGKLIEWVTTSKFLISQGKLILAKQNASPEEAKVDRDWIQTVVFALRDFADKIEKGTPV